MRYGEEEMMFGRMSNREMRLRLKELLDECKYLRELHWELEHKHNMLLDYFNLFENKLTIHRYCKKGGPEQA